MQGAIFKNCGSCSECVSRQNLFKQMQDICEISGEQVSEEDDCEHWSLNIDYMNSQLQGHEIIDNPHREPRFNGDF
jgi:hypothetical protein